MGLRLRPGEGLLEPNEVVQLHVAVAVGIESARAEVLVPRDLVVKVGRGEDVGVPVAARCLIQRAQSRGRRSRRDKL